MSQSVSTSTRRSEHWRLVGGLVCLAFVAVFAVSSLPDTPTSDALATPVWFALAAIGFHWRLSPQRDGEPVGFRRARAWAAVLTVLATPPLIELVLFLLGGFWTGAYMLLFGLLVAHHGLLDVRFRDLWAKTPAPA